MSPAARRPEIDDAGPLDGLLQRFPLASSWALAALAAVAVGFALYVASALLLPIVAAFVVGVMLSPLARRLEAMGLPRALVAPLIVAIVTLFIALIITLIVPRVSELTNGLPTIAATLGEKLRGLDGLGELSRRLGDGSGGLLSLLPEPTFAWVPSTIGVLGPPIAGFLLFLVVLFLFIAEWPDLRKGLVMAFASRHSRLTALRILNEVETGLANYLVTVTLINLSVGAITGIICTLGGMPNALGFGALAATLNFIPFLGPMATFAILLVVGVAAIPDLIHGLAPAAAFALLVIVEGQFVTPVIVGRRLELNGLAVLLSLSFWAWLWGPLGAFLSSPILIVALILKQRLYEPNGHEAAPAALPARRKLCEDTKE